MYIKVSISDYFADFSTNAMGIETKIKALVELLDDNQSEIEINGNICKCEDDIRDLLKGRGIINNEENSKGGEI